MAVVYEDCPEGLRAQGEHQQPRGQAQSSNDHRSPEFKNEAADDADTPILAQFVRNLRR